MKQRAFKLTPNNQNESATQGPRHAYTIVITLCLAGLLSGNVASAKDHRLGGLPLNLDDVQAKFEAKSQARFQESDADGSGTLNIDEFSSARTPAEHADGEKLTRRELRRQIRREHSAGNRAKPNKHPRGMHRRLFGKHLDEETRHALREATRRERFTLLDTNQDGVLSELEYAQANRETSKLARRRALFNHLDVNADGELTQAEMPQPIERLRAADANGDGLLTREEMRAARRQG